MWIIFLKEIFYVIYGKNKGKFIYSSTSKVDTYFFLDYESVFWWHKREYNKYQFKGSFQRII